MIRVGDHHQLNAVRVRLQLLTHKTIAQGYHTSLLPAHGYSPRRGRINQTHDDRPKKYNEDHRISTIDANTRQHQHCKVQITPTGPSTSLVLRQGQYVFGPQAHLINNSTEMPMTDLSMSTSIGPMSAHSTSGRGHRRNNGYS